MYLVTNFTKAFFITFLKVINIINMDQETEAGAAFTYDRERIGFGGFLHSIHKLVRTSYM